jgi:integrase
MRAKLTRRLLDAKEPDEAEAVEFWDTDTPGFYARHYGREGSRWRYLVKYRVRGNPRARHHVIGEDGTTIPGDLAERLGLQPGAAWSPEAARKEASRVRGLALDGKDPDAGRRVPSLRDFAKRYLVEHAEPFKKPRSVEEDRGLLDRHILKELGDYRLDRLDQGTVTRFAQARKDTPTTANRCLALVSHLYTKAGEWGIVPAGTNPARGVPRFREAKRQRFLSVEELARLGDALRELKAEGDVSPFALAAIRLLIFTGMRPSEVLALTWESVDLARGVLSLADSKTGAKTIHLAAPAVLLLSKLPKLDKDARVFPPLRRDAAEADLESAWRCVRTRAKLDGVRLYDAARHSYASFAVSGGASLYLTGALLGHKKSSTTERYAHVADSPLKTLAGAVGKRIAAAMGDRPAPAKGRGELRDNRRARR